MMPPVQPSRALRAALTLPKTLSLPRSTPSSTARSFSSTLPARAAEAEADAHAHAHADADAHAGHGHESHYDPPTGWLFGVKPGEKVEKEGWEGIWVYGFFGSLALGVVGYAFKPDTSIQTWALEEARRRLEVEGILKEPESKS